MLFWRALIGFPLRCRLLGDFVIKDRELQPRRQSREIGAAAAFVMIGKVEGERRTVRDRHEAVIAHHHHHLVAEKGGQPLGLVAEPHSVKPVIDRHPVVEPRRGLIDRRKNRVLHRTERRRVMRMQMDDAAGLRIVAVHRAMDRPCRGVDPRPDLVIEMARIDKKHVACLQFREMNPERVHQEHLTVIRHGVGKMVGDPLMHALAGGPAEYRGQIAACLIEIGGDGAHRPLLTGQIEDAQPRRDQQGCAMQNCASAAQWATGCFYRLRQSRRRGEISPPDSSNPRPFFRARPRNIIRLEPARQPPRQRAQPFSGHGWRAAGWRRAVL